MPPTRRPAAAIVGDREAVVLAATLGGIVRETRRSMGLTQVRLAARIGIGRARLAEIERGEGVGSPLGTWIALGLALKRPLAVSFTRPIEQRVRDAGHLAIQELVLAAAERQAGVVTSNCRLGRRRRLTRLTFSSAWTRTGCS